MNGGTSFNCSTKTVLWSFAIFVQIAGKINNAHKRKKRVTDITAGIPSADGWYAETQRECFANRKTSSSSETSRCLHIVPFGISLPSFLSTYINILDNTYLTNAICSSIAVRWLTHRFSKIFAHPLGLLDASQAHVGNMWDYTCHLFRSFYMQSRQWM